VTTTRGAPLQVWHIGCEFHRSAVEICIVPNNHSSSAKYSEGRSGGLSITETSNLISGHVALFPADVIYVLIEADAIPILPIALIELWGGGYLPRQSKAKQ